jgi:hypothetical protein
MGLIDEEGNLFGVLNVVDALVVVVVLVGLGGGVLFVTGNQPGGSVSSDIPTTYATVDLGPQPAYLVDQFREGDSYSPHSHSTLTVTDVHLSPQADGARVLLRARIQAPATGETVSFDGSPVRHGRELAIETDTYSVSGTVTALGEGDTVNTEETAVLLRGNTSAANGTPFSPGASVRVGNQTVATVRDVMAYDAGPNGGRIVYVSASLAAYTVADTPRFGDVAVGPGKTIILPSSSGTHELDVLERTLSLRTTNTRVVVNGTVGSDVAASIEPGDRYRVDDRAVATVDTVHRYGTADPGQKRLFVGLTLSTVTVGERPRFGDTVVREGSTIAVRTDAYEFTGEIHTVGSSELRGEPTTRTVTLRLDDAPPRLAESVREGMTETAAGRTLARLRSVERAPETVVLTSQDGSIYAREHPTHRELSIEALLTVRETDAGVLFKGRPIQEGSTVVLDLGPVTIRTTVEEL